MSQTPFNQIDKDRLIALVNEIFDKPVEHDDDTIRIYISGGYVSLDIDAKCVPTDKIKQILSCSFIEKTQLKLKPKRKECPPPCGKIRSRICCCHICS